MEEKKKFSLSMPTLCALTWFGHGCGSSMATGRLAVQYGSRHGIRGLVSAVFIWVVTCGFCYIVMEYGRMIRAKNYHDVVDTIYWPNKIVGRVMNVIWDFTILVSTIVTCGTCVAGSGSLLESITGLNYYIGMVVFVAVMLLLFLVGPGVLQRLGKLSLPMFILLLLICVVIISAGWSNLMEVFAGKFNDSIAEGAEKWSSVFRDGLTYGMTQSGFVATGIVYSGKFETRRETANSCLLAFLLGGSAMVLCTVATLAWFPETLSETLPLVYVMQMLGGGVGSFLRVIYYIVLICAYVSTAGSIMAGAIARFKPLLNKAIKSEKIAETILLLFFQLTAAALGSFGLTALVDLGFGFVGTFRQWTWFWPLLILGPIAIWRVGRQQKLAEATEVVPETQAETVQEHISE